MATIQQLSTKHVLGIKYLTTEDINLIFTTADDFKEVINRPVKKVPSLRDVTVANLFFENSYRNRGVSQSTQKFGNRFHQKPGATLSSFDLLLSKSARCGLPARTKQLSSAP